MKTIVISLIFLSSLAISAQKPLDTIFVNDRMNVSLFFPNPIRQGITGTSDFIFTYNKEMEQYLGLLQARPGEESNLLVLTKEGQVYSYILKYATHLPKLNYFVSINESIGNERPIGSSGSVNDSIVKTTNGETYFKRFSEYLINSRWPSVVTKHKKGMLLRLIKVAYNKNEVYLVLEIKNKSGIDFELDYLNISITNDNEKRKSSSQKIKQDVLYKHDVPTTVEDKDLKRFVYVLPKFVLGNDEKLLIEVKELKGSRFMALRTKL